jgi:hypothetical protein
MSPARRFCLSYIETVKIADEKFIHENSREFALPARLLPARRYSLPSMRE